MLNLFLKGGSCVFSEGIVKKDILTTGEKINRLEDPGKIEMPPADTRIIDVTGKYVFPGFIDAHTHYGLGEGAGVTADGFTEGSRAAAFGGVTTFIDFADHLPGRTLLQGALKRMDEAAGSVIDYALHQGVYRMHEGMAEELEELKAAGITALKIFTTYKKFGVYLEPAAREELFPLCMEKRMLVAVHPEDEEVLEASLAAYGDVCPGPDAHPLLRPDRAEAAAVLKAGRTAAACGMPLYIVHVSSAAALDAVRALRESGAEIIAETAPHYLFLTDEKLRGSDGALFLMTPPLRKEKDLDELRTALCRGEVQVIATDHCSFTPLQKKGSSDCRDIPAGVPGSGEAAILLHKLCRETAGCDLTLMTRLFSENPARLFGMYPQKGSLIPGTDADITIFSPETDGVLSADTVRTEAGYTPYEGISYSGAPVMTILRGNIIIENGIFTGSCGAGRFLPCGASSVYRD